MAAAPAGREELVLPAAQHSWPPGVRFPACARRSLVCWREWCTRWASLLCSMERGSYRLPGCPSRIRLSRTRLADCYPDPFTVATWMLKSFTIRLDVGVCRTAELPAPGAPTATSPVAIWQDSFPDEFSGTIAGQAFLTTPESRRTLISAQDIIVQRIPLPLPVALNGSNSLLGGSNSLCQR